MFSMLYLTIAILAGKAIYKCECLYAKKLGYVNFDTLDPYAGMLLGVFWPLAIPAIAIFCVCYFMVRVTRAIFY